MHLIKKYIRELPGRIHIKRFSRFGIDFPKDMPFSLLHIFQNFFPSFLISSNPRLFHSGQNFHQRKLNIPVQCAYAVLFHFRHKMRIYREQESPGNRAAFLRRFHLFRIYRINTAEFRQVTERIIRASRVQDISRKGNIFQRKSMQREIRFPQFLAVRHNHMSRL